MNARFAPRSARPRGNPILASARPILVLGLRLRQTVRASDPAALRREAAEQVRRFEQDATRRGVAERSIVIARHALCTYLDLAASSTPWDAATGAWSSVPLVYEFYGNHRGGEEFISVFVKAIADPAAYADLLEIQYLCLLLGFDLPPVPNAPPLETLRNDAARIIASRRGNPGELSPHWQGAKQQPPAGRRLAAWQIIVAGVAIILAAWLFFEFTLSHAENPLREILNGGTPALAPIRAPAAGTTLRDLLSQREQARELTTEVVGTATHVILDNGGLFDAGGDVLNPRYTALIEAIGDALEQVPGRVLVVGHTDDQPVNSPRFLNTEELSRARAVAVADILKRRLKDPARVAWAGAGDSEPRFKPPSLPENRARNRRIEIIHFAGERAQ